MMLSELTAPLAIGLITTSSSLLGAAVGLYFHFPKRVLAGVLALAAGALISALAIELAYESVREVHHQGFSIQSAWSFVGGGFATGAIIYYWATLFLDQHGAAVRLPSHFAEYALGRKQHDAKGLIELLSRSDLLRHLPPEGIEAILPCIRQVRLEPGQILFRAGDSGDSLYIVERGSVEVIPDFSAGCATSRRPLAVLEQGQAFGEMALLTGGLRTATIRAAGETELLQIGKVDFDRLIDSDRQFAQAVQQLSHQRAISNLTVGGLDPSIWAKIASRNVQSLSRHETSTMLVHAGHGAGLAIVLGNVIDTIPGCLVIGANYGAAHSLSLTLMLGMFVGGVPEAAASAAMLRKAAFSPRTIFALWSMVLVAGAIAAVAGKLFIASSDSLTAVFFQAVAGGAVLALVAHTMIPEAIHEGGSVIVLPTVAGFLFALYLALFGGLK